MPEDQIGFVIDLLKDVNEKCDELLTWKSVHEEAHKSITESLDHVDETLFANNGGVTYRVRDIESCLKQMKVVRNGGSIAARRWQDWLGRIAGGVATALIVALVFWLMYVYKATGGTH
jgi:hypothetical protein